MKMGTLVCFKGGVLNIKARHRGARRYGDLSLPASEMSWRLREHHAANIVVMASIGSRPISALIIANINV